MDNGIDWFFNFLYVNPTDNGERVRSLLCDREALARPSGMAGFIAKGVGFNLD